MMCTDWLMIHMKRFGWPRGFVKLDRRFLFSESQFQVGGIQTAVSFNCGRSSKCYAVSTVTLIELNTFTAMSSSQNSS